MMIAVALLTMFQATAAAPPEAAPLRRAETTIASPYAYQFPDELFPYFAKYMECLNPNEGLRSEGVGGFEAASRARMQACRPTRDWAVASATAVFKPDHDKPGGAPEQVAKLFDDYDATDLRNAKYIDEQFRAQMGLPPTSTPAKADDAQDH